MSLCMRSVALATHAPQWSRFQGVVALPTRSDNIRQARPWCLSRTRLEANGLRRVARNHRGRTAVGARASSDASGYHTSRSDIVKDIDVWGKLWSLLEALSLMFAVAGAAAVLYTGNTMYAAVCIVMPFVSMLASRLREASLREVHIYLTDTRFHLSVPHIGVKAV
eukprot:795147-Pyramimonas_sp.AAC.1